MSGPIEWESVADAVGPRGDAEDARRDRAARVWWSCIIEPGDRVGGALLRARGAAAAEEIVRHRPDPRDLAVIAGVSPAEARAALARWQPRVAANAMPDAVDRARRNRVQVIVPGDASWPSLLHDLGDHAPPCLWVRGDAARLALDAPSVALVGARAATSYGEHVANELAAGVAQSGIAVVSGAAYGIDGAAHRAALAVGGVTFAYLAGGCDRPYPAGHTDLIERIAASGAVISEVPCGAAPTKWRFLQRNRLIAAASDATIVVEAGIRSGSLNTAGHAAALGRPLGAVPGPVTSAASAGTHRLLREFDAVCITGPPDARELVGWEEASAPSPTDAGGADRTRVLDALSERTAWPVGDVAARAGMSVGDVEAVLGSLLLEGRVEPSGNGWRRRAR
ncbi:DNA-processing protein DprA [Microbacterium sp. cx-55]|uniref:DNA-processing protein DprA n=1 Tax=unclassified Microbacterium TaxID=2609290 RepID=UPI001CBF333F|nr:MULTISPECIES: DNA-processing protein DprA [unclassified Microbacterium]MBZ4486138.1 DNA-processing protein DprA [Microbacterium sp. cx-55]MCC4907129.1 DNA-processing protein DprA [Microbacterium sp. cx-59]UGB33991.1 DNA-processing protein DprA [Microbacterium sp. cx-55]